MPGYFELPSTWTTPTGTDLTERNARFASPTAGSAAFMADIAAYGGGFAINQGDYTSVHCVATNSDPLVVVADVQAQAVSLGWDTLHIPASCDPPAGTDGHVVITNTDVPEFLWTIAGAVKSGSDWSAAGIKLWARTRAAAGVNGAVGRGMGVMSAYDDSGGAGTACRASADTALGTVLASELDAGVIPHALRFAYNGYRLLSGNAQPYPCVSYAIGVDDRPDAGTMGQRIMLDPSIDIDALDIGDDLKTIFKAAQNYGYIQTDGSPNTQFYVEHGLSGYDFRTVGADFADDSEVTAWLAANSREIPCLEAYAGESIGADPPTTATYYVSKTGNDSNDGSIGLPKLTIAAGLSLLSPGDTLLIGDGTYNEALNNGIPDGISVAQPTIVQAINPLGVTLNGVSSNNYIAEINNHRRILVDGLVLDAVNCDYGVTIGDDASGIGGIGSSYVTIQNCEVKNATGYTGITFHHLSDPTPNHHITIKNNIIHDCGTDYPTIDTFDGHAIYPGCRDSIIEGNTIYNIGNSTQGGAAIHQYATGGGLDNNIIRNNRIYDCWGNAVVLVGGNNTLAYNNILYNNDMKAEGDGGFSVLGANIRIYNNTIYDHPTNAIGVAAGSTNVDIQNNIIYANASPLVDSGTGTIYQNNVVTDPRFADAANADFHLLTGSPAAGVGVDLSVLFTTDFDGVTRTVPWTVGAYAAAPVMVGGIDAHDIQSGIALTASTLTLSLTVTDGDTVIVLVGARDSTPRTHIGVTFDGDAMTNEVATSREDPLTVSAWKIEAMSTGTYNVVITLSGSADWIYGVAAAFTGADASALDDTDTDSNASGTSVSTSITTTVNNAAIMDLVLTTSGAGPTMTPATNRVQVANETSMGDGATVSILTPKLTAGSQSMAWTAVTSVLNSVAVALKPFAVTPDPGTDPAPANPTGINASAAYLTENARSSRCPIYQVKILERGGVTVVTAPTAYWNLDEVEGARLDSIGTAHLTDIRTVTYIAAGKIKRAAHFTRASAEYLTTPDQPALRTGAKDWSFAAWVWLDSKTNRMGIAGKSAGTNTQREWTLVYNDVADRFAVSLYYAAGAATVTATANTLGSPSLDTWYYIVVRHTASTKTIGISINGGAEDTNTYSGSNANAGAAAFFIGDEYDAIAPFDGRIDEAGYWVNYKLTSGEIALLYNSGDAFPLSSFTTTREVASFCTAHPVTGENLGPEILVPLELQQRMEVDRCRLPNSTLTFLLQDINNQATDVITEGIAGMQCDFYMGFYHLQWAASPVNYIKRFSGTISEFEYSGGAWRVTVRSAISGAQDKILFNGSSSRLAAAISDISTSLTLEDASGFDDAFDLPQSSRRPIMIDKEIMVYRLKTGNTLSNIQRSGTTGFSVPPRAEPASGHAIGAVVREVVNLGNLDNQTDQRGPYATDALHPMELLKQPFELTGKHGFAESQIDYDAASIDAAKLALGVTAQERFMSEEGSNAKRFLEEQIYLPLASTPRETVDGALGIKLYGAPQTSSPPADVINDAHILDFPRWLRNAEKIINVVIYHYDYMPTTREYTNTYIYRDQAKIDALGRESVLEIWSKGIRSLHHNLTGTQEWFNYTSTLLPARAAAAVDRFGNVAPVIGVSMLLSKHLLQCGDEILATFSQAINMGTAERFITDEPFEIVAVHIDFVRNIVDMELLGFPS